MFVTYWGDFMSEMMSKAFLVHVRMQILIVFIDQIVKISQFTLTTFQDVRKHFKFALNVIILQNV